MSTENTAAATAPSLPPVKKTFAWYLRALVCLVGGAIMAMAYPPYDLNELVWVGLLPLLCVLWTGTVSKKAAFAYGWLFGMGWYCVSFWWIHNVGEVFNIPLPVFLLIAFFPLMTVYSCLPGLWAVFAASVLRPSLQAGPNTDGMTSDARKLAWHNWAVGDLLSTVRSAVGCGALWVCIEWLRANGTLGFSWNSLGMALYDGLAFAQWAEFTGTAALSFIPVFTTVILWGAFRRSVMHFKGAGRANRPWDFYGCVVILFLLFSGGMALSAANSATKLAHKPGVYTLPVMGVQINLDQTSRIQNGGGPYLYGIYLRATKAAFDDIQQKTVQQAMKNPDVGITQRLPLWVVWPESAMGCPIWRNTSTSKLAPDAATCDVFFHEEYGLPKVRQLIREMGGQDFVLFTGVDECLLELNPQTKLLEPHGMHNSLACIPAGFESIFTVSKQHLMPFGEYIPLADSVEWINRSYTEITGTQVGDGIRPGSGSEPMTVPVPGTDKMVGVIPAICYEDTVGRLLTKFVRKGPQVIINVSNDGWFLDSACGVQQARNAAFRCIELRRPMVRAANMGVTCSIAPNGAFIDALLAADGTPHLPGYSYAELPIDTNAGFTLYALFGDWAVALCAFIVLVLTLRAILRRKSPDASSSFRSSERSS